MNRTFRCRQFSPRYLWILFIAMLVFLSPLKAGAVLDIPIIDPEEPIDMPPPSAYDDCGFVVDTQVYLDEVDLLESGWLPSPPVTGVSWRWIPLKFHLVADAAGSFGLSEAQVQQAIDDLNGHYADMQIIFYLGTDIDYITGVTTTVGLSSMNYDSAMVNIYTVPFLAYSGLAPSPGSSARWLYVRTLATINGSTLSHEVGHVFGLYHTHTCVGGECECPDGGNCATAGDLVCDTPADPVLSGLVRSTCVYSPLVIPPPPAGCGTTPYAPDTHNLMSYSFTQCRDRFTQGQFDRMNSYMSTYHAGLPVAAPARTIYVDASIGSDDNPGTQGLPYATVAWSTGEAASGSTIRVQPGVYTGAVSIIGKGLWIESTDGPDVTTITGLDSENLVTFTDVTQAGAGLDGFTLDGGWIGVWCRNSGPTVSHCVLVGQHVDNWAAFVLSGTGYGTTGASPAVVVNNTIRNCTNGGLSNFSTVAPTIRNNVITGNVYGIHQHGSAAQPINDFNDVWGNPLPPYLSPPFGPQEYLGSITAGSGSINADPLLDTSAHLMFGSPCLDAGDPAAAYNDPDGSRNDMGAVAGAVYPDPIHVYAGQSIRAAADTALSGQDILVHAGTWTESVAFKGKTIRVIAVDGPEQTTLIAGNWGYAVQITDGEGPGTEFAGFTVTSPYGFIDDIQIGVGASAVIRDCVFTAKPASNYAGQHINCGGSNSGEVLITRNLFHDTLADNGVLVHSGTNNVTIVNNTFDAGVRGVTSEATGTVLLNNIITGHSVYGVYGTFATADYNDVWSNNSDYGGGLSAGANSISANPVFVAPTTGNYGISTFSPCRDSGHPDSQYNDPDGSRSDMGAYPWDGVGELPLLKVKTDEVADIPRLALGAAWPNPFNPRTDIWYSLETPGRVLLRIYDTHGRLVRTLVDETSGAGRQTASWDGRTSTGVRASSGVYFYRLEAEGKVLTRKMTMVK